MKNKKTRIICSSNEVERFKSILQESLFGPENLDFSNDFIGDASGKDIEKEIEYFKVMDFSDVVEFCTFKNHEYTIDNVTISIDSNGNYDVRDIDDIMHVPGKIEYKPKYVIGKRLNEPFQPPLFGITCLGPGHGFDPNEKTSGFLIWLNHNGIMVDPPVNSTEWLLDSNVSPKFIDSIILTHCHADHDAGTFQ